MISLTRSSSIVFVAQLVANAGFFVAVLILARALGPPGRGTIAFVIVTALVLARLAELGINDATLIFASRRPALRPQLLGNLIVFVLGAAVLVGGAGFAVLLMLGESTPAGLGVAEIALVFLGTVAIAVTDASEAFLVGSGLIGRRSAVLAIVPWIYAGLLAVMFLTETLTVSRATGAWAATMVAGAVTMFALSLGVSGILKPSVTLLRESVAFGVRAWVGSLASFLNLRLDQIILGILATQAVLGIYTVAVNASEVLLYFPAAVATTLAPTLARAEPAARQEQALRTFRILALTTAASAVVALLVGPWLVPAVFSESFRESVAPFLWLLPGAFGYATKTVFSGALIASGSPGLSSIGSLAALSTGIVLDFLLIPIFGAVGAAMAASAAFLAGGGVALSLYRRRYPFQWTVLAPRRSDAALLRRVLMRLPGRPSTVRERRWGP